MCNARIILHFIIKRDHITFAMASALHLPLQASLFEIGAFGIIIDFGSNGSRSEIYPQSGTDTATSALDNAAAGIGSFFVDNVTAAIDAG